MSKVVDSKVAKRYAGALFNTAVTIGTQDTVGVDLDGLALAWTQSPRLAEMLESPLITSDRKLEMIDKLFASEVSPTTLSFLKLLVDKGRENILPIVHLEYGLMADAAHGLIRATATVAVPLSDSQKSSLIEGLKKRTGKSIELDVEINPSILGGVIVKLGDNVIDGSVRGSLERLRENMLQDR